MIPRSELIRLARGKLKDADVLYEAGRYDSAAYICGYAIELKLKARICRTLAWAHFPSTRGEFQDLSSFKTHDLEVLLQLSGIESKVRQRFATQWDEIADWKPEMRYNASGNVSAGKVEQMIVAVRMLMRVI